MQQMILVDSKTGECLFTFTKTISGFARFQEFSVKLISARNNFNRAEKDELRELFRSAIRSDLKEGLCSATHMVLNRYSLELIPGEQIASESKRRGWLTSPLNENDLILDIQ